MRISAWRLALTGVTIVILLAAGIGFVAASTGAQHQLAAAAAAPSEEPDESEGPDESGRPDHAGGGKAHRDLKGFNGILHGHGAGLGLGRRLVHVTATVQDKDGKLIQLQLDHGTIQSIGNGSVTIAEAGGTTVTVSTDTTTVVRTGRDKGALSDLKVGDEIIAQSRVDAGKTLAQHVIKLEAKTGG
jgi:hypothetical protein